MIPDKLTWPKGTKAQLAPARTIPAVTMPFEEMDWTKKSLRWIDDPNGQTLTATGVNGQSIVIMGAGTKTSYLATWQEQDARAALLNQLGLAVPAAAS